MRKLLIIVLVIAIGVFATKQLSAPSGDLISPLSKKDELSFLQRLVDSRVFDANKEKVTANPIDWARGFGAPDPLVSEGSYVVVDGDGNVVLAQDPDTKKSPASLVKLMTAMVALDLSREDEVFTVPKESVNLEPTILMVDEGEKFLVGELLEGALITSANDATDVLARGVAKKLGGSREVFVKLMNQKAQNLDLTSTVFANPTGYDDPRQASTARELAKMTHYALENYPTIKELVATKSARLDKTATHKSFELPNWNALLGVYPGVSGVKIGYTEGAGYVTIVTAERDAKRFMVVLLGAPDRRARDFWATQLLNSAFSESGIKPFKVTLPTLKLREAEWGEQLERAREAQGE
ncbi:MAG: serine hydrolase [bacterium]|nr:serine hydrolase [bacterium]